MDDFDQPSEDEVRIPQTIHMSGELFLFEGGKTRKIWATLGDGLLAFFPKEEESARPHPQLTIKLPPRLFSGS